MNKFLGAPDQTSIQLTASCAFAVIMFLYIRPEPSTSVDTEIAELFHQIKEKQQ